MICFYLSETLKFVTVQTIIHYIVLEKTLRMLFQTYLFKTDLLGVMEVFKINSLKANPGKFPFMVLKNKGERSFDIHIKISISDLSISISLKQK